MHGKFMLGKDVFSSSPEVYVQLFLASPFLPETPLGPAASMGR